MTRVALALLVATACGGAADPSAAQRPTVRLRLEALDGGEIDTGQYRGRVVVLHVFDAASPTAPLDADQLNELAKREPKRVAVVGVSIDPEGHRMAAPWRRATGARYLIGLGGETVRSGASPLGAVRVVPTTIVLDRAGGVVHRVERALASGELTRLVAPLLDPP